MKLVPKIKDKEIISLEYNVFFYLKYNLFVIQFDDLEEEYKQDLERSRFSLINPLKVFINGDGLFVETDEYFYHFYYAALKLSELITERSEIILSLSYNEDPEDGSLDLINIGTVSEDGYSDYSMDEKTNVKDEVLIFKEDKSGHVDILSMINYLNCPENGKLPQEIGKEIEVIIAGDYPYINSCSIQENEEEEKLPVYYSQKKSAIIIKQEELMDLPGNQNKKELLNFLFLREVGKAIYSQMLGEIDKSYTIH